MFNLKLNISFLYLEMFLLDGWGLTEAKIQTGPILLGFHLIYRNIKPIIMLRLLWIIYLCFDQNTKNMEYLTQYLLYPHMWGKNVRKGNYQCSLRTLLISLPKGVPWERRLMVTCGGPETLSLYWLWAILGACESGKSPNPPGSLSLPVLPASTPLIPISSLSALPFPQVSPFHCVLSSLLQLIKPWSCLLSRFLHTVTCLHLRAHPPPLDCCSINPLMQRWISILMQLHWNLIEFSNNQCV